MNHDWPFSDPKNVAVFTTSAILEGSPILHVTHDTDGYWQFHDGDLPATSEAKLVSLASMVARDSSLKELADLPLGWCAIRKDPSSPWLRSKK